MNVFIMQPFQAVKGLVKKLLEGNSGEADTDIPSTKITDSRRIDLVRCHSFEQSYPAETPFFTGYTPLPLERLSDHSYAEMMEEERKLVWWRYQQ